MGREKCKYMRFNRMQANWDCNTQFAHLHKWSGINSLQLFTNGRRNGDLPPNHIGPSLH